MSKKSFLGKTLAVIGAVAAIGGVCYIFRDKIKESKIYNTLGVDKKLDKAKSLFDNNFKSDCCCNGECDCDEDLFYDDDEFNVASSANREYTPLSTPKASTTDTTIEPINTNTIPTISFNDVHDDNNSDVISYENEGLSDVSKDPDVLDEQTKLDN